MLAESRPLSERIGLLRDRWEARRERGRTAPPDVEPRPLEEVLADLGTRLGGDPDALVAEEPLVALETALRQRLDAVGEENPFPAFYNVNNRLARLCYVVTRLRRPRLFVETGVASGLSSSYILTALGVNGHGHLHSIDPAVGTQAQIENLGWLVPEELRERWTLHRRRSRAALRAIGRADGPIDVFLHDGLHTEKTMRWELETATSMLAPGGVVLADDVERHSAFADWARQAQPSYSKIVKAETRLCGVAIDPASRPAA